MSDIIQLLPDHVANQIAAGEVVQRPASVVKELLENAIDAGATEIKLLIKDAGKTLVQVIDNGKGMSTTDARLSFERHATSKIRTAEDLFNLSTKGFRGEALASIAAIAHVEVKTKQSDQELGTHIKIEGSTIQNQDVIATPTGTSIAVKNLFFNIPARRNFLKSNSVELRHIKDEFYRVALTHPSIAFDFYSNESEILNLNSSNLRQRIVAVFGKKINEKLVPIQEHTDIITIDGFVSKPEFAKKKRGEQFFFVNNRFIKNGYLHHSVINAFDQLLPTGHHPSYFLYLSVPPNTIDINIHPTKTEIKFDNEQALYQILRSTIKHSLGQYNVAPVLDFNRDETLDVPYSFKDKTSVATPKIKVNPSFNPFESEVSTKSFQKPKAAQWESLYTGTETAVDVQQIEVEAEVVNQELFETSENEVKSKTHQVHKKYILSVIKSGVVYINQNLAHQRILYEELLTKMTVEDTSSQQLLFPLTLVFNKEDIALCKEIRSDLESVGFQFSSIENDTITLDGIPVNVNQNNVQGLFEELFEDIKNEIPNSSFSQLDTIAKSLARSLAIKNGTKLNSKEQEELLEQLFSCKEPNQSPFGKKTFITLSSEEIQLKFDN
ncbi:DNA mismatch repair endonuclease MutL [Aureibaculum sp. 2210JD6-5]|uniref:DNA mismatch repair endonuclease MutL n=1 Tax=Aureibaculum sp. 2210JD6-5 TaxID=3103957 RepID=UPI002AAE90CA|nr:DNA mismatch repair endonuclease MutL [Aureibaculum sp. 2210JD6-5]MDY7395187.1 DNA mismatch repair endonuclease MutL [Aureibaculum sp. 2210JD6-5]